MWIQHLISISCEPLCSASSKRGEGQAWQGMIYFYKVIWIVNTTCAEKHGENIARRKTSNNRRPALYHPSWWPLWRTCSSGTSWAWCCTWAGVALPPSCLFEIELSPLLQDLMLFILNFKFSELCWLTGTCHWKVEICWFLRCLVLCLLFLSVKAV